MGYINQEGYYKGTIVSGEFGKSAKGLPQSVWMLKASEVYDEEGQEYLPADSEADEITAWLTMFNHDNSENFNTPQIKKVTGWDGADFNVLADLDLEGVELSFRVEFGKGDYADKLGVNRVAEPDASPTRTVTKLDKTEVDALQARFAGHLAKTKAPVKAASAKSGKKTTKTSKEATRPTAPKTTPPAETEEPVGKCTGQEAYDECFALSGSGGGDELEKKLNKVWKVKAVMFHEDEDKNTDEQWFQIKGEVLKETSKV